MIRIATVTSIYPNAVMPGRGLFVENRLRHLVGSGEVEAQVIAPVMRLWPGFRALGIDHRWEDVPDQESRFGINIRHPRFTHIPAFRVGLTPWFMSRAIAAELRRLQASGFDFDLIDAHYFYPDGVAAVMAAKALGKPVVVTARGSDLNIHAEHFIEGPKIRKAVRDADGLVAVSAALGQKLVDLGAAQHKLKVLRNGVDLEKFCPGNRTEVREKFNIDSSLLLSVGNLVELKGHDLTIRAMRLMPDARLMIAGAGPLESDLKKLADSEGVADRVIFLGSIDQANLPAFYRAADVLVLASAREGMANVLLESLACGTPVVASDIPGMGEVIDPPESGSLMKERTPEALASAAAALLSHLPSREDTRAYAGKFDWAATTRGQIELFHQILERQAFRARS